MTLRERLSTDMRGPALQARPGLLAEFTGLRGEARRTRWRTVHFVAAGAVLGGVTGALIGRTAADDCETECTGYGDLSRAGGALRGAAIGIPAGALVGYGVARVRFRR